MLDLFLEAHIDFVIGTFQQSFICDWAKPSFPLVINYLYLGRIFLIKESTFKYFQRQIYFVFFTNSSIKNSFFFLILSRTVAQVFSKFVLIFAANMILEVGFPEALIKFVIGLFQQSLICKWAKPDFLLLINILYLVRVFYIKEPTSRYFQK